MQEFENGKVKSGLIYAGNMKQNWYDTVTRKSFGYNFDWSGQFTTARFYGGDYADLLGGGTADDTLNGHGGNDTLNGDYGSDGLYGEDGNDTLNGGGDGDTLYAGEGNDTLNGDNGGDALYGEDGNDTLNGGNDTDILFGGNGTDILLDDNGNDILLGEAGNDTLSSGSGTDTLIPGTGTDTMTGGSDNDAFKGTSDELAGDTITDLSVGDSIVVSNLNLSALNGQAATGTLALASGKTLALSNLSAELAWSASYSPYTGTTLKLTKGPVTTYSVAENSTTGTTVGTAQASSAAQGRAAPGAAAVSVQALDVDRSSFIHSLVDDAGGRFAINRGTGEITVRDALLLDHEQDQSHTIRVRLTDSDGSAVVKKFTVVVTNVDPENVRGDAGANTLVGGDLNDSFRGGNGNDSLKGGAGSDTLRGDAGNDRLRGGEDADTFAFARGTGRDRAADFSVSEGDELDFSAFGYASVRALLADAVQKGEHVKFVLDTGDKVILSTVDLNTLRENQDAFLI